MLVHDFPSDAVGKAIPYGVYDVGRNEGWGNVGVDHDTAAFAVASIRSWWSTMGKRAYDSIYEPERRNVAEGDELYLAHAVLGYCAAPAPTTPLRGVRRLPAGMALLAREGSVERSASMLSLRPRSCRQLGR